MFDEKIKTVYLSGPMTGIENGNKEAFDKMESFLVDQGLRVFNPATAGVVEGWNRQDYLRRDTEFIAKCDAIILLNQWYMSRGVAAELMIGLGLGLKFFKCVSTGEGVPYRVEMAPSVIWRHVVEFIARPSLTMDFNDVRTDMWD